MSLTSALSSAMSGIRAASRGSEIVSSNIANANTPGYARRTLSVSSDSGGAGVGVRINGVVRHVDQQVINDRRLADAEVGYKSETTSALTKIEDLIGTPDNAGSLAARVADFEKSLITATSRPDATERLTSVAFAAKDLASSLNTVAQGIQDTRTQADQSIDAQVRRLDDALKGVETLNARIVASSKVGTEFSALQDQRQLLIDDISEMVPVRMVPRDYGAVALYSTGGAILLEGRAVEVGFEPANVVTPYESIEDGTLSGLTLNGISINTSSESGRLRGGTLGAQFEIRDEIATDAQTQIDALARDLISRFEDNSVDPTLSPGDAGLFTDAGSAFDPADELGVANRIALNTLVDPEESGETWRIRDGLGATAPGDVGNGSLLVALTNTLVATRPQLSGSFGASDLGIDGIVASLSSQIGADRLRADQQLSFASAQSVELAQVERANGVDTDAEIQNLMVLEQAYAANARVISTIDEMFDTLMRI
ncbi:flagellar hook-associated protein FlgK [Tateyamaria sp. ANG-S1]|uniref:flagellar hook-associated protein FlgK n=1 Tax=Tateyamaria sp. ANG-S1 TaxID=1577905 RepID=UPI00057F4D61|nr:flagellar hook-associated protein FlgK [Tateyamaria sp. ANG-S1]KIC49618.1 flagellar hook protein FlgK [Tateyamaria sp. ANG-S1]